MHVSHPMTTPSTAGSTRAHLETAGAASAALYAVGPGGCLSFAALQLLVDRWAIGSPPAAGPHGLNMSQLSTLAHRRRDIRRGRWRVRCPLGQRLDGQRSSCRWQCLCSNACSAPACLARWPTPATAVGPRAAFPFAPCRKLWSILHVRREGRVPPPSHSRR